MTKIFQAKPLTENEYRAFESVYNDFRDRAKREYKFELEPLDYKGFIDAIRKELIQCIVLLEDSIPTAFLIYTTSISEAVELNIIHCCNMENIEERSRYLIKEFLNETEETREDKVVCYPMLGTQKELIHEVAKYGFKFIGIVVLRFMMFGTNSKEIFKMYEPEPLPEGYTLSGWDNKYFDDAVKVVNEAFENRAAPQFFFLRLRVVTDGLNECDEIAVASGFAIVCGPQECSYREIVEAASVVGSVKALGDKDAAEGIVDVDELKFRQTDSGFLCQTGRYIFPGAFVAIVVDAGELGQTESLVFIGKTCFGTRAAQS